MLKKLGSRIKRAVTGKKSTKKSTKRKSSKKPARRKDGRFKRS